MDTSDDRPPATDLPRRLLTAATGSGDALRDLVHDRSEDVLRALVANPSLEEDDLLVVLGRHDLPGDLLRQVAGDARRTSSYKVRLAIVRNPKTPASASLKFVSQLFLFDLVAISLVPHVPREVKAAAEGSILARLKEMPLGARLTLARRTGSATVLARLLADENRTVVEAAAHNGRMTEETVLRALRDPAARAHTVDVLSAHPRWSPRRDVRYALLRSRHTPLARALSVLGTMTAGERKALARDPAVPVRLRQYIRADGTAHIRALRDLSQG
jgi:hypothetical protein